MKKTRIIYNDDIYQYMQDNNDAIIDFLNNNDIDPLPNAKEDAAQTLIDDDYLYLADLINNFDKKVNYSKIVVVASLGLWYGRRKAIAEFKTLFNAFYKCLEDCNKVYFEKANTTLTLDACHHDGCNNFKFYKVVNNKKYAIKFNEFMNY